MELGTGQRGMRIDPIDHAERGGVVARIPITVAEAKAFGEELDEVVTVKIFAWTEDAAATARMTAVARAAKRCRDGVNWNGDLLLALIEAVEALKPGDLP